MNDYEKILVAIDTYATYEPVIERAFKLANKSADISLIHVTFPHVYFEPYGAAFDTGFIEDIQEQSQKKLKIIANKFNVPESMVHSVVGNPAEEIHKIAEQIKADLIVLGTHGKSGLKLLLGSTANAVLHGVQRDVLAVKV